jgi:excisionase family DNA binding protein
MRIDGPAFLLQLERRDAFLLEQGLDYLELRLDDSVGRNGERIPFPEALRELRAWAAETAQPVKTVQNESKPVTAAEIDTAPFYRESVELLTQTEAARRTGLSASTIKRALDSGALPHVALGTRRIPIDALRRFAETKTKGRD